MAGEGLEEEQGSRKRHIPAPCVVSTHTQVDKEMSESDPERRGLPWRLERKETLVDYVHTLGRGRREVGNLGWVRKAVNTEPGAASVLDVVYTAQRRKSQAMNYDF